MIDSRQKKELSQQNAAAKAEARMPFSDAPNGLLGMAADMANLFSSFEILAGDPDNVRLRQSVLRSAHSIASQFNHACSRLNGVEYGLNTSIQKDVVRANYHLHDIASFNQQIIETLVVGGTPEPWAAQRARCLDALSWCVNVTASLQPSGAINVIIDGVTMVDGAEKPDCLATYPDRRGNLCVQAHNAGAPLKLVGGSIVRKITVRDSSLADLQSGLNALAAQLITRVNSIFTSACDLNGKTGEAFFIGRNASDIGVNRALAGQLQQWRAATAETDGSRMVARALAKLGSRKYLGLGHRTFGQEPARAESELDEALAIVNEHFDAEGGVSQIEALGEALNGETANFMRYQQACASSAKVIHTLEEMTPMN